jgi:hypothetical protein
VSSHTDVLLADARQMVANAGKPLPANPVHRNSLWVSPITEADAWLWSAYWTAVTARGAKSPELARIARSHLATGESKTGLLARFTRDDSDGNIKRILRQTWGQVSSIATPTRGIAKVWSLAEEGVERTKGIEQDLRPIGTKLDAAAQRPGQKIREGADTILDTGKKLQVGLLVGVGVSLLGAWLLYRVAFPPPLRVNRGRSRTR